jgi:hypothetical protein
LAVPPPAEIQNPPLDAAQAASAWKREAATIALAFILFSWCVVDVVIVGATRKETICIFQYSDGKSIKKLKGQDAIKQQQQ